MTDQPDFSKLFFDYFAGAPRPISYDIRKGPNQPHDVQFVSSLLHDACFKPEDVGIVDGRLTIRMTRDRWENTGDGDIDNLESISATLTIEPVISGKWHLLDSTPPLIIPGPDRPPEDLSLWMTSLEVRSHEDHPDDERIVTLVGWRWRYVLAVRCDAFLIRLQDDA